MTTESIPPSSNLKGNAIMRRFNLALATLGLLGVAWMIAGIWWAYPDNHGAGPVWFQRFFIAIVTASGVGAVAVRQLHWPTLGIAVLGLLATWIVDQRNIIVDYDEWIARGMPKWGQSGTGAVVKNRQP